MLAVSDLSSAERNRALAGAPAPAAPFPRLKEDNCNRKHSRKSRYSTEMNILGYIKEHGENNVGIGSDGLRLPFVEGISEEMAFISDGCFKETISVRDVDTGASAKEW